MESTPIATTMALHQLLLTCRLPVKRIESEEHILLALALTQAKSFFHPANQHRKIEVGRQVTDLQRGHLDPRRHTHGILTEKMLILLFLRMCRWRTRPAGS